MGPPLVPIAVFRGGSKDLSYSIPAPPRGAAASSLSILHRVTASLYEVFVLLECLLLEYRCTFLLHVVGREFQASSLRHDADVTLSEASLMCDLTFLVGKTSSALPPVLLAKARKLLRFEKQGLNRVFPALFSLFF